MEPLNDADIAALQARIPKNKTYPTETLNTLAREGRRDMVFFYNRAREICRVQFESYRQVLKLNISEVAIANSTRYWLKDYIRLWEFLNRKSIPPVLYILAQTESLKRQWQVRGMRSERSLARFYYWIEAEGEKGYLPSVAAAKVDAKVAALENPVSPADQAFAEWRDGSRYILQMAKRAGVSFETMVYLESWHLPGGFLAACPLAVELAESNSLDKRAVARINATVKTLQRSGVLDGWLGRVMAQPEFKSFEGAGQ